MAEREGFEPIRRTEAKSLESADLVKCESLVTEFKKQTRGREVKAKRHSRQCAGNLPTDAILYLNQF
jgi:hypothetical protein